MKKVNELDNKKHFHRMIIVNIITGLRALGGLSIIPIFILMGEFPTCIAAICFFATDFIDGKLARLWGVQSFFGALFDSLSDKLFGIIALCILSFLNPIFICVIINELLIFYINVSSLTRGNNIQSSWPGKIKMGVLSISIVGSFLFYGKPLFNWHPEIVSFTLAITEILASLYVAIDYARRAKVQDKKRDKSLDYSKREKKSKKEIIHDLFNTEFYVSCKDKSIKELIYK